MFMIVCMERILGLFGLLFFVGLEAVSWVPHALALLFLVVFSLIKSTIFEYFCKGINGWKLASFHLPWA